MSQDNRFLEVIFAPRRLKYETEFPHMPYDKLHLIDVSLTHPLYIFIRKHASRRASYRCWWYRYLGSLMKSYTATKPTSSSLVH